eukprot:388901_1
MAEENVVTFSKQNVYGLAFVYGVEKHMIGCIDSFNSYDGAVYHVKFGSSYQHQSIVIKCSKEISFERTELHLQMMKIFNENSIPCPKPIKTVNISTNKHKKYNHPFIYVTDNNTIIHCMHYVKGAVASKRTFKSQMENIVFYKSLGNVIGNISKCLKDFDHKEAHFSYEYSWDIRYTNKAVIPNMKYIQNDAKKLKVINYYFNQYKNIIAPNIKYLRHSVIHGDLNDDNILCNNNKVVAVLDFDAHYTCTIFDLAICCSYFMAKHKLVKQGINMMLDIVYGYNHSYPLAALEIKVLWTAICCRMVISAMEGYKYMLVDPNNKYINSCNQFAWNFLYLYADCDPVEITQLIKKHINHSKL